MLNPRVGSILSMGSPQNLRRIVVLPALSRPRIRSRTSLSLDFTFYGWLFMVVMVMVMVMVVLCVCVCVGASSVRGEGAFLMYWVGDGCMRAFII